MESEGVSLLSELLAEVQSEMVRLIVAPDSDSPVSGTCGKDLLLDTDIKTQNSFTVETCDQVFKLVFFVGSLQI